MNKIIITTDSGSNPRIIDNMVPAIVTDGNDTTYYDTKKVSSSDIKIITNVEVFERALSGERFHTAAPNVEDFITVMKPYLDKGDDIIHLSMGSGISEGSVNSSSLAANMLNNEYGDNRVTIIDTLTGGSGGTIINDYANSLINSNLSKEEIINKIEDTKKKILTSFYISKVEGFVKSGRAPKEAKLLDRLSLRYRIDVSDKGRLYPKLPPMRGTISSQFMKYLKNIINDNNKYIYDSNYLALLTTRLKEINLDEVKDYLFNLNYFIEDLINELPFYGAISSYGVEDQVGIALIKK